MAYSDEISKQLAFYKNFPPPRDPYQDTGELLDTIGNVGLKIAGGRKLYLENQKLSNELQPTWKRAGLPSEEENAAKKAALQEAFIKRKSELMRNVNEVPGNPAQTNEQRIETIRNLPEPLAPQEQFAKQAGLPNKEILNLSPDEMLKVAQTGRWFQQPELEQQKIQSTNDMRMANLQARVAREQRMFPKSALSIEGQEAANRAGLGDFIPESTARIINGANPLKLPTFDETTSLATAGSIQDKLEQVQQLFPLVADRALGFGNYQVNKYGQYIPGVTSDPDIVDFYTNINSINNAMIYYMSGKQINEQESKRIKSELLEPELNKDAFQARMNSVIENFNYLRNLKDLGTTGVGKRNPFDKGVSTETNPPSKSGGVLSTSINDALSAIEKGADRNAVAQRLIQKYPQQQNAIKSKLGVK